MTHLGEHAVGCNTCRAHSICAAVSQMQVRHALSTQRAPAKPTLACSLNTTLTFGRCAVLGLRSECTLLWREGVLVNVPASLACQQGG